MQKASDTSWVLLSFVSVKARTISSNNDFLAAGGFPFAFSNRFFQVFECGDHIMFEYLFTLSHGYIYVTWFKMKFINDCIIYIDFIFPSPLPKSRYTLKPFLSSFWGFWKLKKPIPVLILALSYTLYCVLFQFGKQQ